MGTLQNFCQMTPENPHFSASRVSETRLRVSFSRLPGGLVFLGLRCLIDLNHDNNGLPLNSFKRQSNHVANIFGRNGGYMRSDKTPATSSRHEGKSVPRPVRAENALSLSSHRYVNNSEPPVKNTKMWKSIVSKFCLHRVAEALQHSH